ncbi:hypothetical protein AUK40_04595 [Candidatus Wirthbacteria bacterium CG2_30_54_11]|uniref:Exo-alpha-sialidase n=1 Tax=Candidatus Wirthbacteria bacterium CG2_30_54_11 TaxID=1817892 RepID=A0A1J5II07_9BACT|nr:MAG: hypothetical protein AUK40_04595 [Candidatus Wirthbacteria bacterium CG2_30_54_11]
MKKILAFSLCAVCLVLSSCTQGTSDQTGTKDSTDSKGNKNSSQHSSRSGKQGPYYHQVYAATSTDGIAWATDEVLLFDHSSVPGAVILGDKTYLYMVDASYDEDQLSVAVSTDYGVTFGEKTKVVFDGMSSYDAVDPHPEIVDGRIRLYYLGDFFSRNESRPPSQTFTIYYSESDDGISFDAPKKVFSANQPTTDPDVFTTDSDLRMFVSQERNLILASSTDGGKTFVRDPNFSWSNGGVCDTWNYHGELRTYYCGQGIQYATGAGEGKLTAQTGTPASASPQGCDPSVIELPDGTYRMFYKQMLASGQPQNQMPGSPTQGQPPPGQNGNNPFPQNPPPGQPPPGSGGNQPLPQNTLNTPPVI